MVGQEDQLAVCNSPANVGRMMEGVSVLYRMPTLALNMMQHGDSYVLPCSGRQKTITAVKACDTVLGTASLSDLNRGLKVKPLLCQI